MADGIANVRCSGLAAVVILLLDRRRGIFKGLIYRQKPKRRETYSTTHSGALTREVVYVPVSRRFSK